LVDKLEDWEFSSFRDYAGLRNGTLCNKQLAGELLQLPTDAGVFYRQAYASIDEQSWRKIL